MSELESKLLKGGYMGYYTGEGVIGLIKGDARSLDYSSYEERPELQFTSFSVVGSYCA